jgi:Fe-S-cluster-containing dehydrogenase component
MEKQFGILANLDRCVGCFACEVACKQENNASPGTPWIRIHTVGPKMVFGKLRMDYVPLISKGCNFCRNRKLHPSCVDHCPTKALAFLSENSILDAINSGKRYQVCMIK